VERGGSLAARSGSLGLRVLTSVEFLVHLSVAGEPVVEECKGEDVAFLRPTDRVFEKLIAETEAGGRHDCSAGPGFDVNVVPCGAGDCLWGLGKACCSFRDRGWSGRDGRIFAGSVDGCGQFGWPRDVKV
jgi:hypothetical protein